MTHKRFIKLAMGQLGYSRNEAIDIAHSVVFSCGTYSKTFSWFSHMIEVIMKEGNL